MGQFGLMVQRAMRPDSIPILVDLGYVDDKATRDRADALMAAGISRFNLSIEGSRRLLIKLPTRKAGGIFGKFPIIAGETYWQTTHHWRGLGDNETMARIPRRSAER